MVLSAHIVVGVAVAAVTGSPELALSAALLSHYAMDAIPHREYEVKRLALGARGAEALKDLWKVALDMSVGFGLITAAVGLHPLLLLAGLFAILPDGGSFVYFQLRTSPASPLSRIFLPVLVAHAGLHNKVHWWKPRKISWPLAILTQTSALALSLLMLLNA